MEILIEQIIIDIKYIIYYQRQIAIFYNIYFFIE